MHGNRLGLDAVLDDLNGERFDQMVCLGDAIQGGPQPRETVARLRELGCAVVMGNADAWLLSGVDSNVEKIEPERKVKMEKIRLWSLGQLDETDLALIREFQPTVQIDLPEGGKLVCGHGSPKSFDDVILPTISDDELKAFLVPLPKHVYCGGHTHVQLVRHLRESFFFNPGSAGAAYRHEQFNGRTLFDSFSEYAVLTVEGQRVRLEFRRVGFDLGRMKEVYRKSGRPFAEEAIGEFS